MTKISLELEDIKALASDSRLEILKALDGKKQTLQELTRSMKLNKATLHVHLSKLHQAGFIKKKERSGHKWVYYSLTWKGECLLHPENTKIVVLFGSAFLTFCIGIFQLINYARGKIVGLAQTLPDETVTRVYAIADEAGPVVAQNHQFFQNVANISNQNQTVMKLSQALNGNATIQGLANNFYDNNQLQWSTTSQTVQEISQQTGVQIVTETDELLAPQATNMIASVQDPTFLYIGLFFLALFTILIIIASWRLWKTRVQNI
jgi:DNA-binding transcriptional ArsR family regulator